MKCLIMMTHLNIDEDRDTTTTVKCIDKRNTS